MGRHSIFLRCYCAIFSEIGVVIDKHLRGDLGLTKKNVRWANLTEPPLQFLCGCPSSGLDTFSHLGVENGGVAQNSTERGPWNPWKCSAMRSAALVQGAK